MNTRQAAKDFANVYALKLTDRQHALFVERLAVLLREYYERGRLDGEFRALEAQEEKK